jgi:hypothetical protein
MDAVEWFDRTTGLFANIIPPMRIESEEGWIAWAENARVYQPQVPDPQRFLTWRDWGDRFNQVMYLVTQ